MKRILGSVALSGVLMACAGVSSDGGAADRTVSVNTLHAGANCGREEAAPAVRYIQEQAELERLFGASRSHLVGSAPSAAPQVDFERHAVVLVEMGQKPTGGYRLELGSEAMTVSDGTARLVVNWHEPEEGMLLTQALTSPCLLVQVPQDDYRAVEVVDQDEQVRASQRL